MRRDKTCQKSTKLDAHPAPKNGVLKAAPWDSVYAILRIRIWRRENQKICQKERRTFFGCIIKEAILYTKYTNHIAIRYQL